MDQVSGLMGLRAIHWRDDSQRMETSREYGRGGNRWGAGRNLVRSWLLSALGPELGGIYSLRTQPGMCLRGSSLPPASKSELGV